MSSCVRVTLASHRTRTLLGNRDRECGRGMLCDGEVRDGVSVRSVESINVSGRGRVHFLGCFPPHREDQPDDGTGNAEDELGGVHMKGTCIVSFLIYHSPIWEDSFDSIIHMHKLFRSDPLEFMLDCNA